jgi:mannose-1-phosphate guanylyltransferase
LELDAAAFKNVPDDSIDYAVMEKSGQVAVVPCNNSWNDIGSWTAFGDLVTPDANGNRVADEALLHNTQNNTIQSNGRLVDTVGVENIIIDTSDAVLVADKSCAQDCKHIYAELKAKGHNTHKLQRTVHHPLGTYSDLEEGVVFKIKPGASLSLQMHPHPCELWIVVSGSAKVVNSEKETVINKNESTYIPAGHKHRLTNPLTKTCVMIEVQSSGYLGEDDILRFQEIYECS